MRQPHQTLQGHPDDWATVIQSEDETAEYAELLSDPGVEAAVDAALWRYVGLRRTPQAMALFAKMVACSLLLLPAGQALLLEIRERGEEARPERPPGRMMPTLMNDGFAVVKEEPGRAERRRAEAEGAELLGDPAVEAAVHEAIERYQQQMPEDEGEYYYENAVAHALLNHPVGQKLREDVLERRRQEEEANIAARRATRSGK